MNISKVILRGIVGFLIIFVVSCKKDDNYIYPPIITEILSARTGEEGTILSLYTDKGKELKVINRNTVKGYTTDSLYRGIAIYEITDSLQKEPEIHLYGFQQIVSPYPISASRITGGVKTDPVTVQSIWRSGDYINLALLIKAQNGIHLFHFVEDVLTQTGYGGGLQLTLYHDQSRDVLAYNQKVYLSVPLSPYKGILFSGDPIYFTINTYENGFVIYRLTY